jgi:hypothetical protein
MNKVLPPVPHKYLTNSASSLHYVHLIHSEVLQTNYHYSIKVTFSLRLIKLMEKWVYSSKHFNLCARWKRDISFISRPF